MADLFTSELVFTLAFVTILIVLVVALIQLFRVRRSRAKRHETEGVGAGTRQVIIEREEAMAGDRHPVADRTPVDRDGVAP